MTPRRRHPAEEFISPREMNAEWKKGKFRKAYLLFGEDIAAKGLATEALREAVNPGDFGYSEFSGESDDQAGPIVSDCSTPPMLSDRRLVVVRNVKFSAAGRKIIADYLRNPLETTTLLLIYADAKVPSWKEQERDILITGTTAAGAVVQFRPLTEGEAVGRLRKEAERAGFELSREAAEFLVEEAGSEWGILRGELEKLKLFVKGRKEAGLKEAAACLGYRQETGPFELQGHLTRRETLRALDCLRRLLREGNEPIPVLMKIKWALNRQLKAKRMLKAGEPENAIFKACRVNRRFDSDFVRVTGRANEMRLIRALKACLETEVALKSKAWLDPGVELEHLVLRVCGKK